jgi:ABC-2 type transport system permease protein
MGNTFAIAERELRAYFASPMAYIIVGLFALVFGFFFYAYVGFFAQASMRMGQFGFGGQQVLNINQELIRPLLLSASTLALFLLPMVTMRTYAEEKRTGTIELLLTSPVTDVQIIMGKFLGAVGLFAVMLLPTLLYIGLLFWYGNPEWRPIAAGYLGLLLLGASFISLGLLISSFTSNQIVAAIGTFAVLLLLFVIGWLGETTGGVTADVLKYLAITEHFEDFSKGVVDTRHVIYYLSFITFGLFLTARSVDSERWRG